MTKKCVWDGSHAVREKDGYCTECAAYSGVEILEKKPKTLKEASSQLLDTLIDDVLEEAYVDGAPQKQGELPDISVVVPERYRQRLKEQMSAHLMQYVNENLKMV